MHSQKLSILQKILQKYNLNYGNVLHLCVHIRDNVLFESLKNEHLEFEKHNGYTPIELARRLNYTEFYTEDIRGNTIKSFYLQKYLNPIKGYETRKIVLTKDCLQSHSNKITNIDLAECNVAVNDNKLLIKHNGKKYKFKGKQEDVDELYELVIDYNKRHKLADNVSYKDYYYVFLSKILVDIIGDKELEEILVSVMPESLETERDEAAESSESYYDSCEEQFFDVNEK